MEYSRILYIIIANTACSPGLRADIILLFPECYSVMAGTEESRREKKIATAPKKEEDEDDSNLFLPSDEFSDSAGSEEERSSTSEKQNAGRTIDANRSSGRPKTSTPRRSKRSNFGNRYEQAISKEKEYASGAPVRNAILGNYLKCKHAGNVAGLNFSIPLRLRK